MPDTQTTTPETEDQDLANKIYAATDTLNFLMRRAAGQDLQIELDVFHTSALGRPVYPQARTLVSRPFARTTK